MNRKLVVVTLCLLVTATGAFAFSSRLRLTTSALGFDRSSQDNRPGSPSNEMAANATMTQPLAGGTQSANDQIPETVIYRQLFRHLEFLKQKADEKDANGGDGQSLRSYYKRHAKLSDLQQRDLEEVAAECNREAEKLDKKAKKLTDDFRAKNPGGKLAEGELPPAPPAELAQLWNERNNVITQAREKLRATFGEQEFQRFNEYVKRGVMPNIKPVKLNPSTVRMPDELRNKPRK